MFTGIITNLGEITNIKKDNLTVKTNKDLTGRLSRGGSISLNGVCLTVVDLAKNSFKVDVMPETRKRTNLAGSRIGDLVNLELPLTPKNYLSGHIVYGHIDGVGTIEAIKPRGNSQLFTIATSPKIIAYMVEKGAVTIDGISLTLTNVGKKQFSVGIIPLTFRNTNLKQTKIGSIVNIEVDIIGKYIRKFLEGSNAQL